MTERAISLQTDTHKSRGVVIPNRFGITKGLQSWVSLDDLIFQSTLKYTGVQHSCKLVSTKEMCHLGSM